uniref:Uncharacterized protein n=1 Tax=Romanomermis culicivorax TaxID=13658 RepID=A0A915HN59_ROMCU
MMKCKMVDNDDTMIKNSVSKLADISMKIAEKGGSDTKIVREGGYATKTVEEGGDATKIIEEGGDATVDPKTVSTQMMFVNELFIDYLNDRDYDSSSDTSSLDAETKCICKLRVLELDIPWFFEEQVVKGKLLTHKQKWEMADLSWIHFSPKAKTFYKNIAKACNHLHCEVKEKDWLNDEKLPSRVPKQFKDAGKDW